MKESSLLNRALAADPADLRNRVAQMFFNRRARNNARKQSVFPKHGHLVSLGVSEDTITQWWNERQSRLITSHNRELLHRYFVSHPNERDRYLKHAQMICDGKMPIFSHIPVDFVGEDRWRKDHILGVTAPQVFYSDIAYLDVEVVGDSKHVWEPNRFGWMYWLGAAYIITGEKRYANTFANLLYDWTRQNPYPIGINYCSALEVAFRCYALCWALEMFGDVMRQSSELLSMALETIWIGMQHIERNLSYTFAPNTHLLGEAFSLFACGSIVQEFAESSHWRQLGGEVLATEAGKQIHLDGTHKELSSCYHLYTTDFYVQAVMLARACSVTIDATITSTAEHCAVRLAELAPRDLYLPQFNDCDGGRLDWFATHPLDSAPTLYAGKTLFPDFPQLSTDREPNGYALWLCDEYISGPKYSVAEMSHTPLDKKAESGIESDYNECDSGLLVYKNSQHDYALLKAGPFGYMDCGHSHDSQLALILTLDGQPILADCGTGAYTQSQELRDRYRLATGKNVLTLNGKSPSQPNSWFNWKTKTDGKTQGARRFDGGFYFKGRHYGYTEALGFECEVTREVIILDDGIVLMIDSWGAKEPVTPALILTLDPALRVNKQKRNFFRDDTPVCHYLFEPKITLQSGECEFEPESEATTEDGEQESKSERPPTRLPSPRVVDVPFSKNYGELGVTRGLQIELAEAKYGALMSIFSRIGPITRTNTRWRYIVGEDDAQRELLANTSGKISLGAFIKGKKDTREIVFAR